MTDNKMPTAETQTVELSNGDSVQIKPFLAPDLLFNKTVADALAEIPLLVKRHQAANPGEELGLPDLLAICREPLFTLVREAVGRPAEWYADKDLADLAALSAAVLAVNMSKYEGKVLQALARLTQSL